nr:putative ribonuclease H-like domain-containing protein [Tanacetum cinerariifolium]
MQVTLHYEAIVMQVTLHDKRIVMQVTLHYEAIVMQVTLYDKRIVVIAFNVELSPNKPAKELSHTHRPSAPIIKDWISDLEDDYKAKLPQNAPSFVQPPKQVKTPRPSVKPVEISIPAANHKTTIPKPKNHGNIRIRKACFMSVLTKSKLVPITVARPVTVAVPKPHVTRPRPAKPIVTKPYLPPRRHINHSSSHKASTFPLKVTAITVPQVNAVKGGNPQHALKDKEVINSRCSRHMTGNMSYLSDFEEINGRYVAFGGNPKGGKISGKGKIKTGKLDFDDVYFVKELKFNLFSILQISDNGTELKNNDLNQFCRMNGIKREFSVPRTPQQNGNAERKNRTLIKAARTMNRVLVTKPKNKTLYELLLGRNPSIGFMRPFGCHVTILNTLDPLGKFDGKADDGFLVGYYNINGDAAFEGKKPKFKGEKHESEFHVSPSSSAQTKKHDDKTKREAKGKSPVELSTGYRNLSAKFKDFSDNSINEVNVVDSPFLAVGKISTYNTNTFSVACPSNTVVKLEHITYSDDKEDVGAEADFINLETTITVIPIPTTRVHKDHQEELLQFKMQKVWVLVDLPNRERAIVARIEAIRLFLDYASFMVFMVYQMDVKSAFLYETIEEEVYVCQTLGFEDPDYLDKVYNVVKALYGLHQDPKAWYETLANYLLENGFHRGKIDQTLFIKRQKGDILLVQIYVNDIIFGSTNKDLCKAFEKLMKDKF